MNARKSCSSFWSNANQRRPTGRSRALAKFSGLETLAGVDPQHHGRFGELGFIASPHLAGRSSQTPRGYRFFVDTLLTIRPLEEGEMHQLEGQLNPSDPAALGGSARNVIGLTNVAGCV